MSTITPEKTNLEKGVAKPQVLLAHHLTWAIGDSLAAPVSRLWKGYWRRAG